MIYCFKDLFSEINTTPKKRRNIVTSNQYTSMTQRDVVKACQVSLRTVNNILKRSNVTGITEKKLENAVISLNLPAEITLN